jgi:gamma-glutamyltranspeptidase / glutathione hydrolase
MDLMSYLTRTRLIPLAVLLGSCGLTVSGTTGEPAQKLRHGTVACVSPAAADIGADVLSRGGNAVDAAVATAFALAVTWPEAGNLGGGGYMLVYPSTGEPAGFDFREVAPKAATREMFVEPKGRTPHRRVGVPGTVAGLALAHRKLGKLPWKDLVVPAVRLAEGFEVDAALARSINLALKKSNGPDFAELRRVFGNPGQRDWRAGDRLVQLDLAKTLSRIAEHGPEGFYAGPVADLLVAEMKRAGGLITKEDLADYRPLERKPMHGTYRDHDIWCMPPSSSGGITLLETLNILENFDLRNPGRWSPRTIHLMAEATRRAYRDRARHLGDPAFVQIPDNLTDKAYAKKLAAGIDEHKATPSAELAGDIKLTAEAEHTTHFSIVDAGGTAVSMTYTLEDAFGSRVVVPGAGFLLNDEMNDFNWLPGVTNASGRIGTPANEVAPGKRMLSSMCPTIVAKNGKPLLVTGSPGGRTIINTVLCVVVNVIDFDMTAREAVDAPRQFQPWFPDRLQMEPAAFAKNAELRAGLEKMGHRVEPIDQIGDAHTIWIDPTTGVAVGAADHRRGGKASNSR